MRIGKKYSSCGALVTVALLMACTKDKQPEPESPPSQDPFSPEALNEQETPPPAVANEPDGTVDPYGEPEPGPTAPDTLPSPNDGSTPPGAAPTSPDSSTEPGQGEQEAAPQPGGQW